MTANQKTEWLQLEQEIHTSFKNVRLEDGIGYFEAGALDDYLSPDSLAYQTEKAKDERNDWTILLVTFKHAKPDESRHCFMDAKGLRFYLPFLMVRKDSAINSVLYFYISDIYKRDGYSTKRYTEMISLLTQEQKRSIYHFYVFMNQIEQPDFRTVYLNEEFDLGEEKMKGFDFMTFLKEQFNPE